MAALCLVCSSPVSAALVDYASRFGETAQDSGRVIALDADGNRYIAGALPGGAGRGTDILIAKLSPEGALLTLKALGAGGEDIVHAIAVDSIGRVYLAGETDSVTLPQVDFLAPAVQSSYGGVGDGFLAILDSDLELLYMSHIGGSGPDAVLGMALDGSNAIYLTGSTASDDFPGVNVESLQLERRNGGEETDAFVLKLSPEGGGIVYSTYLGGDSADSGNAIAVDALGRAVVAGVTASRDFPVSGPVFQSAHAGAGADAFVARLSPAGDQLVFSTFLGGGALDGARAVALDGDGDVYVAGYTSSMEVLSPDTNDVRGFPLGAEPAQPFNAGGIADAFVSRITADGSALVWSTYLGSADHDEAMAIDIDADGRVAVGGFTAVNIAPPRAGGLPLVRALQFRALGDSDGFVARFDGDDGALLFSSWIGGSGDDRIDGIAMRDGRIHVTGATRSSDFFARGAVLHGQADFGEDAFLLELDTRPADEDLPDLRMAIDNDPMPVPVDGIASFEIATISDGSGDVSGVMTLVTLSGATLAPPIDPACRTLTDINLVCTISDASGGESLRLQARPRAIGSMRTEAALLRGDQADRVMDNNTAVSTLTVVDTSGGRGAVGGGVLALLIALWLIQGALRHSSSRTDIG